MVSLLPYPSQYFHCVLWQTVTTRTAETKWLSFAMFMNYMRLNYPFFFCFLRRIKADSKVDAESSANHFSLVKTHCQSHLFNLRKELTMHVDIS